jgi:hypothetical protein
MKFVLACLSAIFCWMLLPAIGAVSTLWATGGLAAAVAAGESAIAYSGVTAFGAACMGFIVWMLGIRD